MCASARSDGGRGDERRGEGVTEGERGERGGRVREGKKKGVEVNVGVGVTRLTEGVFLIK